MPKLMIDGREIEVPKGTRVIEAAKRLGIEIPYYCYHPGLTVAGNCRMCLVEIEKMPRLQIACHMEAQDGMVVRTDTEKIRQTRKHVLEFLLSNHPVDCPVCDQAGECWLQDYYMKHGLYDSRLAEDKIKKHKAVVLGPTVILDSERCILCSRCVRFTDEISKTHELGIVNRGDHSEITIDPNRALENAYSGNVVDVCPVGALTDRDFRFKIRAWYLSSGNSVCSGCARGCNIQVQYNLDRPHHGKGARVMRVKPCFNADINQWWICDEGRYGYKFHDQNRILQPVSRSGQTAREVAWEGVLSEVAQKLGGSREKIGIFVSPQLTNEELFLIRGFFKEGLKCPNLFLLSPKSEGRQDDFLIRADKNPNSKGAELLGFPYDPKAISTFASKCSLGAVDGVIVFGQDLLSLKNTSLDKSVLEKLKWSVFIGSNHNATSDRASVVLPSATYVEKEGSFTNFEGRIQRFKKVLEPLAGSRTEFEILRALSGLLKIAFRYQTTEDVFTHLQAHEKPFQGLPCVQIGMGGTDIRVLAEPVIPAIEQKGDIL